MLNLNQTEESPCRRCQNVNEDKEVCGENCKRLSAYQNGIVFAEEDHILQFSQKPVKRVVN